MKLAYAHVLALAALTALAACEQNNEGANAADSLSDTLADTLANRGDTTSMPTDPVVTELDDVNDSGITGEATATHAQDQVTVSILLKDNARADVTYPAHIHTGSCEEGGPVAVALEPVRNLQSQKTISLSELPADQAAFVQVHDEGGRPVACGNMEGHEGDEGQDTTRATTTY